jgi:hypothetical protein
MQKSRLASGAGSFRSIAGGRMAVIDASAGVLADDGAAVVWAALAGCGGFAIRSSVAMLVLA